MPDITCTRCNLTLPALTSAPIGGTLGDDIVKKICQKCWDEWVQQQVLLINHYGLQMADPDDRKRLREAMKDFLGLNK